MTVAPISQQMAANTKHSLAKGRWNKLRDRPPLCQIVIVKVYIAFSYKCIIFASFRYSAHTLLFYFHINSIALDQFLLLPPYLLELKCSFSTLIK